MSYRHPNGFRKYTLFRFRGYHLRLHVWTRMPEREPDAHDHRWDFVSVPLGFFWEERFACHSTREEGDLHYLSHCVPHSEVGDGPREVLRLGLQRLRLLWARGRRPLVPYFCPAGEIHRHRPLHAPAASLVLTFPAQAHLARIWRRA